MGNDCADCREIKDLKKEIDRIQSIIEHFQTNFEEEKMTGIEIKYAIKNIEKDLQDFKAERKEELEEIKKNKSLNKNFWRDKGVSIFSSIITGLTLAFLLIRFGLK